MDETYSKRISSILAALDIAPDYGAVRQMRLQPETSDLVPARVLADGRELRLVPDVAAAWESMRRAAAAEQVTLLLISGFRSVDYQRQIIERKRARGDTLESILRVNAAPGFSEHHTGRAVDIGTPGSKPLEEEFETTEAFRWLLREAAGFGFHLTYPRNNPQGIVYEPWHWLHVPPLAPG